MRVVKVGAELRRCLIEVVCSICVRRAVTGYLSGIERRRWLGSRRSRSVIL
jgi:hypothetical protein